MQMLDEGQLTDSFGRKVDFRNTVVIMTSNMGTRQARVGKSLGFQKDDAKTDYESMKGRIMEELKRTFNPELLNRIDETIIFHPLTKEHILMIIDVLLEDVEKRLKDRGVLFNLTDSGRDFLADKGFDLNFGARPLKRAIQRYLEDPLAEEILKGDYSGSCKVEIYHQAEDDKLSFKIGPLNSQEESKTEKAV